MDPVSTALIATSAAVATTGLTEVGKTALLDAYAALKTRITQRFGHKHSIVNAIEAVEAKPASQGRQAMLVEEIAEAHADQDTELCQLAERVQKLLGEQAQGNPSIQQFISGSYNATSVYGNPSVNVHLPKDV
ncbi:hypothetical protein KSC_044360 [Ktedonobacter sp. SOSP1-52]|uniref:hypothetical protein n=1 Tax=Ktedonobacter sp. SOSP1-52 TaxID=2778366 RepID=UPI001916A82E|nr:hypothetical protein [Ktedonobacter sp. SOSP1-52]GHO65544.1 hypothetical protein KSC_044360 [Ktedonobacter sp. SOSP1-52]